MPLEQRTEHFNRSVGLLAICTLDGRYAKTATPIANYSNEYGLLSARVEVEAAHLVKLCEVGSELGNPVGRTLNPNEREFLLNIGPNLTLAQADRMKEIEETTDHDVAALVNAFKEFLGGTSMVDLSELVHIPLTSEDTNNLAFRLQLNRCKGERMVPTIDQLVSDLTTMALIHKDDSMLGRTHGQAAQRTSLGHEMVVFADRLNDEARELENMRLKGKFNGAVGTFNAHMVGFPEINWIRYSSDLIESFGFVPRLATTQIAPYEDIIKMFQTFQRVNGIIVDFDQDMWRYISDGWFSQKPKPGQVGSSTMAQKINPLYFERSEGNSEMAICIFEGMSRKLGRSRLQRDLSDSTTIRNMGLAMGFSYLSLINSMEAFGRVYPNTQLMAESLKDEWSTLSEPAQIVMRRQKVENGYELARQFTQGVKLDKETWQQWVESLPIDEAGKETLRTLTPENYSGLAGTITEMTIASIMMSRTDLLKS